ncbi:MAG: ABC transporter ATP-binding protein [Bacteroidales bacterium]
MTEQAIQIRGLRKRYPGFALKDVDLDVPRGYVTGLIGPNGAGKTTLIKLIMNLVHRDAGRITVLGLDNLVDEVAMKSRVGFVYDEPAFYHDVSLRDSARAIAPFYATWSERRFTELSGRFRLPLGKTFKALSHGMKMKFSLAVALSHDADLLLMDEPTAGLDLAFRRELLDELTAILQDEHKSVLFSTHITADLERVADHIAFIHDGAIVFALPKPVLQEQWGVLRADAATVAKLPPSIVKGRRDRPYGVEALVADVSAARLSVGPDVVIERPTFDEVMVFMTRGGQHVEAA